MPSYINELAPWERRQEYYHQIELGKDVLAEVKDINDQTEAMIDTQLACTSAIIASVVRLTLLYIWQSSPRCFRLMHSR